MFAATFLIAVTALVFALQPELVIPSIVGVFLYICVRLFIRYYFNTFLFICCIAGLLLHLFSPFIFF